MPVCLATVRHAFHVLLSFCPLHRKPKEFKAFIQTTNQKKKCPTILEAEEALKRDEKYTSEMKEQLSCLLGSSGSSEGSKQSAAGAASAASTVALRVTPSEEEQHPVYCPCKQCAKLKLKVKPARCQAFIKDTGWAETGARPRDLTRSKSVPNGDPNLAWEQRRKSVPNPFPELERGISYISDGVHLPDPEAKSSGRHPGRGKFRSDRRPPSISSDSSSSIRFQAGGNSGHHRPHPSHANYMKHSGGAIGRRKPHMKAPLKGGATKNSGTKSSVRSPLPALAPNATPLGDESSVHSPRPMKFSYSDEHSSAVLSDDEMSDESLRLQQQLLQPRVTFADVEASGGAGRGGSEAQDTYLEMSLMGKSKV